MPTLCIELPARVSQADVEALRGDLAPYGYAEESLSARFAFSARGINPAQCDDRHSANDGNVV